MEHQSTEEPNTRNTEMVFGHPRGAIYLFLLELWERFAFYGVKGGLFLYLVQDFLRGGPHLADTRATTIVSVFIAFVYLGTVYGGFVADELLGHLKSSIWGAGLMVVGYFLLFLSIEPLFFTSLGLIVVGHSLFKPNITTILSKAYKEHYNGEKADQGFTLFYFAINIGAFLGYVICGFIGELVGWTFAFLTSGLAMLTGLLVLVRGKQAGLFKNLEKPRQSKVVKDRLKQPLYMILVIGVVPVIAILIQELDYKSAGHLSWTGLVLLLLFILWLYHFRADKKEKKKILAFALILANIVVFFTFFEQISLSLLYFAEEYVQLGFIFSMHTSAFNPAFIIVLSIPVTKMWSYLSKRKKNPRSSLKFSFGLFLTAIGFLWFALSVFRLPTDAERTSLWYIFFGWLFISIAELFISPIGLAKIAQLAPKGRNSFFIGFYYFGISIAGLLAGQLAVQPQLSEGRNWLIDRVCGWVKSIADTESLPSEMLDFGVLFSTISMCAFAFALIMLVLSPCLDRLMGDVH